MIKNGPGFMVSQMHSLFNKVVDSGDVVGGDGDHTGSAPPEFFPSNLQLQVSVSVFLCLRPPPRDLHRGGYFYSRF